MKAMWCVLLILLFKFTEQTTFHKDVCPDCFVPDNSSSTGHSCYDSYPHFDTPGNQMMHLGKCVTYNSTTNVAEYHYGDCPYIAHNNTTIFYRVLYIELPRNVCSLNEFMCGPLNREGPLCGKCKDGYGIALYSYTLKCSKCWGHGYGWVLYYFLELFPITVMYFLVVIFHIRATFSPLSALVFMSQIIVYTIRLNIRLHMYIENELTGFPYVALQVLLVLCGVWSLDFFRSVIPPFCVSRNIKTVHALALRYLVAFYPIFLILLTYVCIKLHDNNFRPVVWLWKPFHKHFARFRRRWDSKASIINTFTTFLLLSFSKIIFVSTMLVDHIGIYVVSNNNRLKKSVLYCDPTVESHTQESTIFAAIAGCVVAIFIILPIILLILYPTKLFRRCIACCRFRRWHAVHVFVESFQGQYKDGTNGTHDFRMASAAFLILRMLTLFFFMNHTRSPLHTTQLQLAVLVCATFIYAITRPYKLNVMNNIDIAILFLLALLTIVLQDPTRYQTYLILALTLLLLIPHMALMFYIGHKLANKTGITQCLKRKYDSLRGYMRANRCTNQTETGVEAESDTGSLLDQLINPGEYEPVLIPTTEEHTVAEPTESNEPVIEEPRRLTPVYTYGSIN